MLRPAAVLVAVIAALLLPATGAEAGDYNPLILRKIESMPSGGHYAAYRKDSPEGDRFDDLYATVSASTVAEAAGVFGVVLKTIRRDLILLRQLGFDLAEVKEDKGRKRWRIRAPFERLRTKRQKYRSLLGLLDTALEQAEAVGGQAIGKRLGSPSSTGGKAVQIRKRLCFLLHREGARTRAGWSER